MPFNKGDFTQQGVNGHVNATVRLNEKRLVNIDLTSNENAAGCTITGNVTDLLNNQVYGIGAGASGKITITANGTDIDVAQYRLADVNVAGAQNYKTVNMTFNNPNNDTIQFVGPFEGSDGKIRGVAIINETKTLKVVIQTGGSAEVSGYNDNSGDDIQFNIVSGSVTTSPDLLTRVISGDCVLSEGS